MTQDRLPLEALDAELDLLRFYTRTTTGANVAKHINAMWFGALEQMGVIQRSENFETMDIEEYAAQVSPTITSKSLSGPVYAVTNEILDVLESACAAMPVESGWQIEESDLPSKSGFVWFEHPMLFIDKHDETIVTRALSWCLFEFEKGTTLHITMWTNPFDPRDAQHHFFITQPKIIPPHNLIPCVGGEHILGHKTYFVKELTDPRRGPVMFLLAFLRFIEETWVSTRQVVPGKPLIKRARRTNVLEPQVRIVHLRRTEHRARRRDDDVTEPFEYSHRWIVHGHWRNQWYPSLQTHRPRYIPEYIKGPEDKPLIVHEKLFAVDR